jgi:histidine ammonia-lyase
MITIGKTAVTFIDFTQIVFHNERIEIDSDTLSEVTSNFTFIREFSSDKVIYGINTGFGPMAQFKIPYTDRLTLQYNLIRSHASGVGKPIDYLYCRAMLLDRLVTFLQAKSGVHLDLVLLLKDLLNKDVAPVIYEHGGVGASGDLVQLAHMALAIIGEGELWYKGEIKPARFVFEEIALTPFAIRLREGLAMMNGTSCMTAIGLVNLYHAERLIYLSSLISITINEVMGAFDDHLSAPLNEAKLHFGQRFIAEWMRTKLASSKLTRNRQEHLYKATTETEFQEKVQEYYSLRCTPQIIGPIYDTFIQSQQVLLNELNSVSDNPIVDHHSKNVYHGGNFHGDYVSLEMDKLKIAITKLSMLADRQLNYLLNDKLNGKLKPFINNGVLGLNFGMQGIQYTATSTVAENQSLSFPNYVHSIPSNNDNQDLVSMGSNSALLCAKVIDNTFDILAVHTLALAEAVDSSVFYENLNEGGQQLYKEVRYYIGRLSEDRPVYKELAHLSHHLKQKFSFK